jgi:hypothetical protein
VKVNCPLGGTYFGVEEEESKERNQHESGRQWSKQNGIHGITSQKIKRFIITGVTTSQATI